jgi:hypothetical protein
MFKPSMRASLAAPSSCGRTTRPRPRPTPKYDTVRSSPPVSDRFRGENVSPGRYRAGHGRNLAELTASVIGFAARERLTIFPAVPQHDCGPEVCLGPDELDLPGFLELARKLGSGVLYLEAVTFDPAAVDGDQLEELPAHLIGHKGQTGQASVAFAANGLVHFWEHETAWFAEWEELADSTVTDADLYEAPGMERLSEEERARLVSELADAIVADPMFRAAKVTGRWGLSEKAIPAGTDPFVGREARRQACTRAYQIAQEQYDRLEGQLDDLAAQLLADAAYQQARSAAARKKAAERFLIPRADGFSPPGSLVPEELHARAQELTKEAKASGRGLF